MRQRISKLSKAFQDSSYFKIIIIDFWVNAGALHWWWEIHLPRTFEGRSRYQPNKQKQFLLATVWPKYSLCKMHVHKILLWKKNVRLCQRSSSMAALVIIGCNFVDNEFPAAMRMHVLWHIVALRFHVSTHFILLTWFEIVWRAINKHMSGKEVHVQRLMYTSIFHVELTKRRGWDQVTHSIHLPGNRSVLRAQFIVHSGPSSRLWGFIYYTLSDPIAGCSFGSEALSSDGSWSG